MSGVVCAFRTDSKSAPRAAFERMCAAAAYHGPEPCGVWVSGPIALGHVALRTTPEGDFESQPTGSADGTVRVSFDGRLDNRSTLLDQLSLPAANGCVTDVDLLIAAYQRWGVDCVDHLVGDYAFALWDAHRECLYCARDPLGVRPFYYSLVSNTFLGASALQELMRSGHIPSDINEGMVAEHLTGYLYSTDETLYQRVRRLPPGHRLIVDRRGLTVERHWRPDLIPELRLAPEECVQRFNELFEQAVSACARVNRPFAAQLSGGLDSSSVVSVLARLDSRRQLQHPFEAFTMTFPGLGCDETEYADAVVRRHSIRWNRVLTEPLPEVDYEALAAECLDFPSYPNNTFEQALTSQVQDKGMRVLLTGSGGDEWLDQAPSFARSIDMMRAGRWRALKEEWGCSSPATEFSHAARQFVAQGLDRVHLHAPRRFRHRQRLPRWIRPTLVRKTRLAERICPPVPIPAAFTWSRAQRLHIGTSGACAHAMEVIARTYAHLRIEARHPFYDRRLLEFMIALPEDLSARGRVNKWILREAMRGTLPELVRTRRTKGEFSHTLLRALGASATRHAFSNTKHASAWIDGELARTELDRFLSRGTTSGMWSLWGAYGICAWSSALGRERTLSPIVSLES